MCTEDGTYYVNQQKGDTVWFWDGETTRQLSDLTDCYRSFWDSQYLWIQMGGNLMYRMDHNGENVQSAELPGFVTHIGPGDSFRVEVYREDGFEMILVDKDTLEIQECSD